MRLTSVQDFLQTLQKSSLLSSEQMDEVWKWPEDEPKSFAARLVEEGRLTEWQAKQVLAGKGGKRHYFLGKYKLLDLIGVGGMGDVYKAVQPSIGRIVALKVMNRAILKEPIAVTRFLREIRSAAAVDHPNVVRAYDADCDDDSYFLVMEYVAGKDLKSWIRQEKSLPVAWSCECIRQAALGLEHAFEQGMVHRDIKPSNLLVTQDEHGGLPLVKILDLGLARFASETAEDGDLTRSGQVLGTPDYIAPEQARNTKTADIRADIFSLGCTLFELLTGRLPFPGTTVMEKLMARASEDAPRVQSLRAEVPAGLDAVVATMLERDPNLRYATPAQVAQALAPFAIGTAATTAPSASTSLAANPFTTFDAHADATINVFPADGDDADFPEPAPRMGRGSALAQPQRLRIAAGMVAAAVVFGLIWSMMPGRKASSTASAGKTHGSSKKHKKEADDDLLEEGEESSQRSSKDPERDAALWVLKLGGTLEVETASRPGVKSLKDASWKPMRQGTQLHEVSSVDDLPAGKIQITSIGLHEKFNLRKTDFERLAKLKHLERLDLAGTSFSSADLAPLQHLEFLVRIDLHDTPVSDEGVAFLMKLSKLQFLDLGRTSITGSTLENLKSLHTLTELSLAGTHINDTQLKPVMDMPQLTALNLAGTDVAGPGLQNLRKLTNLKDLDLGGLPMRQGALRYIGGLESVQILRLARAKVEDDDLKLLSGMTSLRELVLASTQITGDGLKHLTWMAELERLDLQETFVGDSGLNSLKELLALKSLRLRRTIVSDSGAGQLHGLSRLDFVDLAETKVTRQGVDALQRALPNCKIEY